MTTKTAFRINELVKAGPFGRSFIFAQIRQGKLVARKAGRTTVVLAADWEAFLGSLKPVEARKAA